MCGKGQTHRGLQFVILICRSKNSPYANSLGRGEGGEGEVIKKINLRLHLYGESQTLGGLNSPSPHLNIDEELEAFCWEENQIAKWLILPEWKSGKEFVSGA